MILATKLKFEINSRQKGVYDTYGNYHNDQPYLILRESTFEEWFEQILAHGLTREDVARTISIAKYFYEVSID